MKFTIIYLCLWIVSLFTGSKGMDWRC